MPVLRWLLPLVAALALVGQSAATWANAGIKGDPSCCCPDPQTCECNHDGQTRGDAKVERCGGEAHLVAPILLIATVEPLAPMLALRVSPVATYDTPAIPEGRVLEPETPPF